MGLPAPVFLKGLVMRYKVNDKIFDSIDDVIDYCIEEDYHDATEDYFEIWVNDNYDTIYIANQRYRPYDILENFGDLDIVIDDYQYSMNEDDKYNAKYELERADPGDEIDCQRYTILVCEDEDANENEYVDSTASIEELRKYYDDRRVAENLADEEDKKVETDMMSLFQHIGA